MKTCFWTSRAVHSKTLVSVDPLIYKKKIDTVCECVCLRGHNDIELNIFIEDVVFEVAAVLYRAIIN